MTLQEIANQAQAEYGNRYQITPAQYLRYFNIVQAMAYNQDLEAFKDWSNTLTIDADEGPYTFPTSPLCRKLIGITAATDAQLFGARVTESGDDYGVVTAFNSGRMWEKIRQSVRGTTRTITFIETPSSTAVYRWVYYMRPPVITSLADDTNFWIPLEYHYSMFYQSVIALADNATYGDKQPEEVLKPYMEPFWESMRALNTPMGGEYDYGISEGQP